MGFNIIAIHGEIGSGKNTVIDIMNSLCLENNIFFKNYAFADKLKKIVSIIGSFPYDWTLTQEGKNKYIETFNCTVGEMLQNIGEGLRQGYRDDIWIKSIKEIENLNINIFITDLRHKNEYEYLKSIGAILIDIRRANNDINDNTSRDRNHISENDLNDLVDYDYFINNDGTLEDLRESVEYIFRDIFIQYIN